MKSFYNKGYKAKKWAVVLACLVKPEGHEEPILQNYVTGIDASTPRQANMMAIEAVWKEAFNRKELMPICGSKVYPWKQYEKLMREAAAAAEKEKESQAEAPIVELPKQEATDGVPS